ncbi:MAG TPA: FUSC family protein, partial [Casimicrobiaceae bacterium]|nr:FUSC family protein [Casimicrobiaceae bacterium]
HDPFGVIAVLAGGGFAIAAAYAMWIIHDIPPDRDYIDWRIGVRRAFEGADAGLWFALCYAGACAVSLLAADWLGLHSPYWATFAVIMVMRREGMVSFRLVMLYILGTIAGVPVSALLAGLTMGEPLGHATFATLAAAFSRLGFALNPALGYLAFTVFLIMVVELGRGGAVPAWPLVMTRAYDVAVGCGIALLATMLASLGHHPPAVQPEAR